MASQSFNDSSWSGYFEITSANAKVDEAILEIGYNLSQAPSGFWSAVKSDGGDIRVANNTGDTEYSRELVNFDSGGNTGWLFFDAALLETASDTTWRIYAGNAAANEPATTDPNGRDNVWHADDQGVWHMEEDPSGVSPQMVDSTGKGNDGSSSGSMTTTDLVTAGIRKGLELDGSDDKVNIGNSTGFQVVDFSVMAIVKNAGSTSKEMIINQTAPGSGEYIWWFRKHTDDTLHAQINRTTGGAEHLSVYSTGTIGDNAFHFVVAVFEGGTDLTVYIDGVQDGLSSSTTGSPVTSTRDVYIGGRDNNTHMWSGVLDEVRHTQRMLTADAVSTYHNNLMANTSFWTDGPWTNTGSGPDNISIERLELRPLSNVA